MRIKEQGLCALFLAGILFVSALLSTSHSRAEATYVPCSEHLQSSDPIWLSIANRICTSVKEAMRLSQLHDTPDGKAGIHQLYLDTFNVDALVKHVTPYCIHQWGRFTQKEIDQLVEKKVQEIVAGFVQERPAQFKQNAELRIGPLGKKAGQLLTRVVTSGQDDIDVTWDFICVSGRCQVFDVSLLSASLSDQVKASLQSRCHP